MSKVYYVFDAEVQEVRGKAPSDLYTIKFRWADDESQRAGYATPEMRGLGLNFNDAVILARYASRQAYRQGSPYEYIPRKISPSVMRRQKIKYVRLRPEPSIRDLSFGGLGW